MKFAIQIRAGSDASWTTIFQGDGLAVYRERVALALRYPTLETRGVRA